MAIDPVTASNLASGGALPAVEHDSTVPDASATSLRGDLLRELVWASRVNPQSPSRKALRKLFERPDVLDYIERLVKADA